MIKLCRFSHQGRVLTGIYGEDGVRELPERSSLSSLLEDPSGIAGLKPDGPVLPFDAIQLLAPVEKQEVWAAGVTYLRSKTARMDESEFSASAYDRVYDAERPEIFFKSIAEKVSPSGGPVGIRKDARWNVPEPELALVINSKEELAGFTIGNDMSSRDIEGENLLYLPQAKVYKHACALGPCIATGVGDDVARSWTIGVRIERAGEGVFSGETSAGQIKRSFSELIDYVCRSQDFPNGVVLLTGTGVVPGDDFTLQPGDRVAISISGIGVLENTVVEV